MHDNWYAAILAGGKGERFWPLSTAARPKQLLSLVGGKPMVAMAAERLESLVPIERTFVLTNQSLVEATRAALPQIPAAQIIGEPIGRDTAPACALATALAKARNPNAVLAILTADQVIHNVDAFRQTLESSYAMAERDAVLLTIGIKPGNPSTAFGYIEAGDPLPGGASVTFRRVVRFVEKPDASTAKCYVDSGRFLWNSGMFVWKADTFYAALAAYAPELRAMAGRLESVAGTDGFAPCLAEVFPSATRISVDYAVMEKTSNIVMAQATFDWDDVGSWPALANHFPADAAGNVLVGRCQTIDVANSIVVSEGRLTALIGVDDVVVVQAPNATLICRRDRAQDVRNMVQQLVRSGGNADVL